MDKLTEDFSKSLVNNIKEPLMDYSELGIDAFINDGVLKELPIVSSITSVLKIGKNIYDRNLLKQTLTFINEFNNGEINEKLVNEYIEKIRKDEKKCEEELGRVLTILNNNIDREKSILLSKIFKSYVYSKISWNEFCEFSEILNRLFIQDLMLLKKVRIENVDILKNRDDNFRIERLYSLGLIGIAFKPPTYRDLKEGTINTCRTVSSLGEKFCNIIFD